MLMRFTFLVFRHVFVYCIVQQGGTAKIDFDCECIRYLDKRDYWYSSQYKSGVTFLVSSKLFL